MKKELKVEELKMVVGGKKKPFGWRMWNRLFQLAELIDNAISKKCR